MSNYIGDSIFWIEVDKVDPNPYQPRREFDEARLKDLAESIRQYGILQPLVVTRNEVLKDDGGLQTRYELIAGERRLRAARLAGLVQVPTIIRANADDARVKLELAIIENLQREDLNAVDRARAFERLVNEFGFKHAQVAEKVGKSREYVSNTLRLLLLPPEMIEAVTLGKITEGHTRPLLMLGDRPEEQAVLFKEIMYKKLSVRDTEGLARRIAYEKVRKKEYMLDPDIADIEAKLTESLGTRVKIEKKENGGKVVIDFFTNDDLHTLFEHLKTNEVKPADHLLNKFAENHEPIPPAPDPHLLNKVLKNKLDAEGREIENPNTEQENNVAMPQEISEIIATPALDDRSKEEKVQQEEDLYSVKNFSI
ncbi:MAG: ParB/RepB/Spo0J family partition protein [bacterium]|nr:ParB/RepB/Spo0J family partition protein [bacterium]